MVLLSKYEFQGLLPGCMGLYTWGYTDYGVIRVIDAELSELWSY